MATSSMSIGAVAVQAPVERYRQPAATLIPVTLRILDDSGRHRITEPIVGILTNVSSEELHVSITGPAGRPLSRNLGRKRKVQLSFINNELHEMIESLVCEHLETQGPPPNGDARVIRLAVPQLPADLFEEILIALRRYSPPRPKNNYLPLVIGLILILGTVGWLTLSSVSRRQPSIQNVRANIRTKRQVAILTESLKYSTKTVNDLALDLEAADKEIESLRSQLRQSKSAAAISKNNNGAPNIPVPSPTDSRQASDQSVRIRNASWEDFQKVRTIRGTAPNPQVAFAEGTVELTTRSRSHKRTTRMLTRLLSSFAISRRVDLRSLGSLNIMSADKRVAMEPDESFIIGPTEKKTPEFVFDHTSAPERATVLKRYRKIGIPEVWLRSGSRLEIYALTSDGYERRDISSVLPELDVSVLAGFLDRHDQTAAIQEFLANVSTAN